MRNILSIWNFNINNKGNIIESILLIWDVYSAILLILGSFSAIIPFIQAREQCIHSSYQFPKHEMMGKLVGCQSNNKLCLYVLLIHAIKRDPFKKEKGYL